MRISLYQFSAGGITWIELLNYSAKAMKLHHDWSTLVFNEKSFSI